MTKSASDFNDIDHELAQLVARRLKMPDTATWPDVTDLDKWAKELNINKNTLIGVFLALENTTPTDGENSDIHEMITQEDPVEVLPLMLSVTWPEATCVLTTAMQYADFSIVHGQIFPVAGLKSPIEFSAALKISGGQHPYQVTPHHENYGVLGDNTQWIVRPALETGWSSLSWSLIPAKPTRQFYPFQFQWSDTITVEKPLGFHSRRGQHLG